jgi:hypothetical protein
VDAVGLRVVQRRAELEWRHLSAGAQLLLLDSQAAGRRAAAVVGPSVARAAAAAEGAYAWAVGLLNRYKMSSAGVPADGGAVPEDV